MKNIILFIIDSMNYSHMKKYPNLTPYINKLKNEGFYFDNMFSQAPYTEAAVMNIYCGQNVLDNNGYIRRFKDAKKTIFEAMKEKGYITYYNSFQPQCYASSLRRGIDYLYNNVGYDLSALWSYRLYLYSNLYFEKKLKENDYCLLEDIMEDNFSEWMKFLNDYINKDESIKMIEGNSKNFDASLVLTDVSTEYKDFLNDKKKYINNLLSEGKNHKLFRISAFIQDNKIKNRDIIKQVQLEARPLFDCIKKKNYKLNKKNCKGVWTGPWNKFKKFIVKPSIQNLKNFGKSVILSKNVFKDADLYDRIDDVYDNFKNAPSAKTHIDHYIDWEKTREQGKPSFSCIHVDDIHNPEVFFTYDTDDIELIRAEFADARSVLDNIPNDYYGNITHDMSLKYIDRKIEYLFNQLKVNNLLDSTIVLICADHGFSFSGNPLRDSFVTNMYLENYNIPCIIAGSNLKGSTNKIFSSKEIPAILTKLADGNMTKEFHSDFANEEYPGYAFIEYCGGGCPDLSRRLLKIGCFNEKYFVATESLIGSDLVENDLTEIYDLTSDPLQKNNLIHKYYDKEKVEFLLNKINIRRKEIKTTLFNE